MVYADVALKTGTLSRHLACRLWPRSREAKVGLALVRSCLHQNCVCFGGKAKPPIYAEQRSDVLCSLGGVQRS